MSKTISLNQSKTFSKLRILLGIILFMYAFYLIYQIFKLQHSEIPDPILQNSLQNDYIHKNSIYLIITLLIWGIFYFILEIGFFFKRFRSFINFESEYFILKNGVLAKGIVITWKELKNIEFQSNGIKITTKNDEIHKINYAPITFAIVQELKADFTHFAQQNNIEIVS